MKGQITIAWVLGTVTTLLIFGAGIFAAADSKSQDRDYEQIQRIATLEARVERLPIIENKVDELLKHVGINPMTISTSTKK